MQVVKPQVDSSSGTVLLMWKIDWCWRKCDPSGQLHNLLTDLLRQAPWALTHHYHKSQHMVAKKYYDSCNLTLIHNGQSNFQKFHLVNLNQTHNPQSALIWGLIVTLNSILTIGIKLTSWNAGNKSINSMLIALKKGTLDPAVPPVVHPSRFSEMWQFNQNAIITIRTKANLTWFIQ